MIRSFCVAHKPLQFNLPEDIPIVWLGQEALPPSKHPVINVKEVAPEFDLWHPFLAGSSGSFAVAQMLRSLKLPWAPDDSISLLQYRKFTSPTPIGKLAPNYPNMFVATSADLVDFDLHQIQNNLPTPYLLPKPINLGNLYHQYTIAHSAPDLLRYTAIAIEMGILEPRDSISFLSHPTHIPGGIETGIYPITLFLNNIEKLRQISMEFLKHHRPSSLHILQRRALAFCNERLGSYMLCKILAEQYNNQIPATVFGYLHCVDDTGIYKAS